jgi:signal transduction histidine kinase
VSTVITNAVLTRLKEIQERHLATLSSTYLEGLAAALIPYVLPDDVWEIFDAIDRRASLGGDFGRAKVVVVDERGVTLASSNPKALPTGSVPALPAARFEHGGNLIVVEETGQAYGRKVLRYQGRTIGNIYADYDISHLLKERRTVLGTLVATNAAIALMLAALGYWAIRRMLAPLGVLSRHLDRGAVGPVHPVLPTSAEPPDSEFGRLFQRYNAMAEAVKEREALAKQLAAEERLASLGRLASGIAHEINNPLGGLFNAIDTLKRHGDRPSVRATSLELIERGLRGIRDVVRTVLATYRADREQRDLTASDLDDMHLLIAPEAARKGIRVRWQTTFAEEVALPAGQVRQVLLNVALNAIGASSSGDCVEVDIAYKDDCLRLQVADEGPGLPHDAQAVLSGSHNRPLSLAAGSGLGLWMTHRMVAELNGTIEHEARAEGGTVIRITLPARVRVEARHVA